MTATLLSLRMPEQLLQDSENISKERGYISVQEYMRETIRKDIESHKANIIRQQLDLAIAQSGSRKKILSTKDRDELAREFVKENLKKLKKK